MLDVAFIRNALNTKRVGRRIEHLESTRSTNDDAWERIDAALAPEVARTDSPRPSLPGDRAVPTNKSVGATPRGTQGGNRTDAGDEMGISSQRYGGDEMGISSQHSSEMSSQHLPGTSPRHSLENADGLVIFAEYQSAGRGRLGSRWESPRGASILCSVAVVDQARELDGGELSLLAAVAARDAVASCTEIVPTIKWPNDLLVSGRKLGGILVEARVYHNEVRAYVVGIGINCLQQKGHIPMALSGKATSLELESRQAIDRDAVAIALLQELDRWLAAPGDWTCDALRREWLARCEPMGRRVLLRHGGKVYSGSMVDIDPTAALVVQLDEGGIRAFNAADTTIVGRGSEVIH